MKRVSRITRRWKVNKTDMQSRSSLSTGKRCGGGLWVRRTTGAFGSGKEILLVRF